MQTVKDIKITEEDVKNVLDNLVSSQDAALLGTAEADLPGKYWLFRYDATASLEWNLYRFTQDIGAYGRRCRQWEEHHHGTCCVVERVREKYLMPQIREFLDCLPSGEER